MKPHPAPLVALVILFSVAPVGAAEDGLTRVIDHRVEGAGWTSFVVQFDQGGIIHTWFGYETAPRSHLESGREGGSMGEFTLEKLRADGKWQEWAGVTTGVGGQESHHAMVRVQTDDANISVLDVPGGRHPHQGGTRLGASLTAPSGEWHRITIWADGEDAGDFFTTADVSPGVHVVSVTSGNKVWFYSTGQEPVVGVHTQVNQFSAPVRAGGRADWTVTDRAYIVSMTDGLPDQHNVANYAGPLPSWDGPSKEPHFAFDGPPGTYTVEPLVGLSVNWADAIGGAFNGANRDTPGMWLFADVVPAQRP